jgi:hypothetical protein
MPRKKEPAHVRKMREEGKVEAAPQRSPWYKSLVNVARSLKLLIWDGLKRIFKAVLESLMFAWSRSKGPWWPRVKHTVKSAPAWFLGFAGLYALVTSFVSISIGDPLNQDPLSAPFTITNTSSLFTLTDINPSCALNQVKYRSGMVALRNNAHDYQGFKIPELLRGNQDTLYCANDYETDSSTLSADVTISAEYKLGVYLFKWLVRWPCNKESKARFVTAKTSDGKLKWLPYGLHDPPDWTKEPLPLNFPQPAPGFMQYVCPTAP